MTTKLSDLLRHANHPGYAKDAEALEEALANAQRDALPCQVLDVLDANRKLESERDEARQVLRQFLAANFYGDKHDIHMATKNARRVLGEPE